jgi:hypothetical protein
MTKPLDTAIALGKGRGVKEIYYLINYGDKYHFNSKGKLISPWPNGPEGEWVNPKTNPDYHHSEIVPFQAGKPQLLPVWDETELRALVDREEFARPDMQEKINEWIKGGLESHDLIAKVREAAGLVTLKDFGLGPLVDQEPELEPGQEPEEPANATTGG